MSEKKTLRWIKMPRVFKHVTDADGSYRCILDEDWEAFEKRLDELLKK